MAVLPIRITGEPALHTVAQPVSDVDAQIRSLVGDMFDTMSLAPGVGLAAPQVGVGLRLFVYHWVDDSEVLWRGVAINPELWLAPTPIGEPDDEEESEGCLSVPGARYALRRAPKVVLRATNLEAETFEIEADGWLARIFQHENDHLDGTLYTDRLDHARSKAATKVIKKSGWGVPGLSWMPGEDDIEA